MRRRRHGHGVDYTALQHLNNPQPVSQYCRWITADFQADLRQVYCFTCIQNEEWFLAAPNHSFYNLKAHASFRKFDKRLFALSIKTVHSHYYSQ